MKLFGKSNSSINNEDNKSILFVCVENARSQMAEGFFKKYVQKGFKVNSAGTKPVSQINTNFNG
jgi:protein-tyrosine-phosphatase